MLVYVRMVVYMYIMPPDFSCIKKKTIHIVVLTPRKRLTIKKAFVTKQTLFLPQNLPPFCRTLSTYNPLDSHIFIHFPTMSTPGHWPAPKPWEYCPKGNVLYRHSKRRKCAVCLRSLLSSKPCPLFLEAWYAFQWVKGMVRNVYVSKAAVNEWR